MDRAGCSQVIWVIYGFHRRVLGLVNFVLKIELYKLALRGIGNWTNCRMVPHEVDNFWISDVCSMVDKYDPSKGLHTLGPNNRSLPPVNS